MSPASTSKSLTVRSEEVESDISVTSAPPEELKLSLQAGVAFLAHGEASLMGTITTVLLA